MVFHCTLGGWLAGVLALWFSWHSANSPRHSLFRAATEVPDIQCSSALLKHFSFPNYQMGLVTAEVISGTQGLPTTPPHLIST